MKNFDYGTPKTIPNSSTYIQLKNRNGELVSFKYLDPSFVRKNGLKSTYNPDLYPKSSFEGFTLKIPEGQTLVFLYGKLVDRGAVIINDLEELERAVESNPTIYFELFLIPTSKIEEETTDSKPINALRKSQDLAASIL